MLLWELIAEAETVVVDAEAYDYFALLRGLRQRGGILVVMVADGGSLAPDGPPGLVELRRLFVLDAEAVHEVGLVHAARGMLVLDQLESEVGGQYDRTSLVGHLIDGTPLLVDIELQCDVAIGRGDGGCRHRERSEQQTEKQISFLHYYD